MNLLRVRRLFAGERVARFGTTGPGGRPHMMPVRFAVIDDGDDGVVACALDWGARAPVRSIGSVARLHDVAAHPRVSLLADHSRDLAARWWVQADAVAEVLRSGGRDPRFGMARAALAERYADSPVLPEARTIVWCTVTGWTGWTGAGEQVA